MQGVVKGRHGNRAGSRCCHQGKKSSAQTSTLQEGGAGSVSWEDEKVMGWMVVMVVQQCECT